MSAARLLLLPGAVLPGAVLAGVVLAGAVLPLPAFAQAAAPMWQSANAAAAWIALAGTALTFVGTLVALAWNRRTTQRQEADRARAAAELARLNDALARAMLREKTGLDARTKYEFDARQRLYQQVEPVLFQLREAVRGMAGQCVSLARTARKSRERGPGEPDELRWLDHPADQYYLRATAWRMLRPLALLRLMQDRMTLVDLRLDPRIGGIYALAGVLRATCRDPWGLGAGAGYTPDYEGKAPPERAVPLQHIVGGQLDRATDALILEPPAGGAARLLRFGEFDAALEAAGDPRALALAPVLALLRGMRHGPEARPVAWRMVFAHGLLARLIEAAFAARDADRPFDPLAAFEGLAWQDLDPGDPAQARQAREAVAAFLRRALADAG